MPQDCSFDIVSKVDMQSMDNAINQVRKEIATRYDFRGTRCQIDLDKSTEASVTILADDGLKLRNVKELLHEKMARSGVSVQALDYQKEEQAEGNSIRQKANIRQGIDHEHAKEIIRQIKDTKLKVQASIQEDLIRVHGKKKDELQAVLHMLKSGKLEIPIQFTNYR